MDATTNDALARFADLVRSWERDLALPLPGLLAELAKGEPVSTTQLARLLDGTEASEETLRRLGVEWDDQGRVVGLGLTQRPTQHQITLGGRKLWAWCAMDTLVIPLLLGTRAQIESPCATTGETIRLTLSPDGVQDLAPPGAVVSQVCSVTGGLSNPRGQVCDHGHFFRTAADAEPWLANHPDGVVLTIAEAIDVCRKVWA